MTIITASFESDSSPGFSGIPFIKGLADYLKVHLETGKMLLKR